MDETTAAIALGCLVLTWLLDRRRLAKELSRTRIHLRAARRVVDRLRTSASTPNRDQVVVSRSYLRHLQEDAGWRRN